MNDPEPILPQHENPKSSNTYVLVFGMIMLVGLLVLAWIGRPPVVSAIGEPLPRLDLQPLVDAQEISNENLEGKIVVLHFWGTWCPPCALEFPEFAGLAGELQGNDSVAIVSVSCSGGEEYDLVALKQKTVDFLAAYPAESIPTYSDAAGMTRHQLALLLPHGTLGYPTTIVVDRDGIIVDVLAGYRPGDMQKLASKVKALL